MREREFDADFDILDSGSVSDIMRFEGAVELLVIIRVETQTMNFVQRIVCGATR